MVSLGYTKTVSKIKDKQKQKKLGVVAHDIVPSTSKAETGGSLRSRLDSSTEGIPEQPGLYVSKRGGGFYRGIDIVGINSILKNQNSFGGHLQSLIVILYYCNIEFLSYCSSISVILDLPSVMVAPQTKYYFIATS